jgi:hypothetical protein
MFKNLVCPMSSQSIDKRASRVSASMTAVLLAAFAVTGFWPIMAYVVVDYMVRVFTSRQAPTSWVASQVLRTIGVQPVLGNKGPKIFAWRVGLMMALMAYFLFALSPMAAIIVAVALAGFNVLDGVFNFCVGCIIYTYVVLPYYNRERRIMSDAG